MAGKKGTVYRPFLDRFWEKVRKSARCWEWTGATNGRAGHGITFMAGRRIVASRASWVIHNGPVPDGLFVLHRCDNAPCVRPDHLYLGTLADNRHDLEARGGPNLHPRPETCKRGHPLVDGNIHLQHGRRRCRTCHNAARRYGGIAEQAMRKAADAMDDVLGEGAK